VFVRVLTEDGTHGIGEASLEYHEEIVVAAVNRLARELVGKSAAQIEHLWQIMVRGGFWRGGAVLMSAVSGIEQALWDLKGKRAGMPVYELLGGSCREHVALYANGIRGTSPEDCARSARGILALGFTAMKLTAPFGTAFPVDGSGPIARAVDIVAAVREAVGPGTRLAIDVHGRLSASMSIRLARALEPYDIWFLEEPVIPEDPAGIEQVARATTIPVAAGERIHSRWGFRSLLDRRAVALIQPDVAHCGGIAEARRIASMAELDQVGFAPHNPLSPLNTIASAHVALATPNFVALECLVDDVPWRQEILNEPLHVHNGALTLPGRPGLGVDLNLEACRAHPFRPVERPVARHPDGSFSEW
jgi:galactonate dehydratase